LEGKDSVRDIRKKKEEKLKSITSKLGEGITM
jgi:hypothetical protein